MKVLLAVESPDRRELLRKLIEHEPGLELVGEVADPIDLLVEVKRTEADAVVQDWPSEETTGIVSILLIEYPDLLLVGIPRDSEHVFEEVLEYRPIPDRLRAELSLAVEASYVGLACSELELLAAG
jgi:DNA-binding NarL/FixJ family response regulator